MAKFVSSYDRASADELSDLIYKFVQQVIEGDFEASKAFDSMEAAHIACRCSLIFRDALLAAWTCDRV